MQSFCAYQRGARSCTVRERSLSIYNETKNQSELDSTGKTSPEWESLNCENQFLLELGFSVNEWKTCSHQTINLQYLRNACQKCDVNYGLMNLYIDVKPFFAENVYVWSYCLLSVLYESIFRILFVYIRYISDSVAVLLLDAREVVSKYVSGWCHPGQFYLLNACLQENTRQGLWTL